MSPQSKYDLARFVSILLTIASAGIAAASKLPELGLSPQAIAWGTVAQACITVAVMFLPRAQGDGQPRADE